MTRYRGCWGSLVNIPSVVCRFYEYHVAPWEFLLKVLLMRCLYWTLLSLWTTIFHTSFVHATFVLNGSDLFGEAVISELSAALESDGLSADLRFTGSLAGLQALSSGDAQAAIVALPDGANSLDSGLQRFPVGSQVAAFVVHTDNPVTEMDAADLVGIYAAGGAILNWSGFTDDPVWKDRKIAAFVADSDLVLTAELFSARVLNYADVKASVRRLPDDAEAIAAMVADDPGAIVLVDLLDVRAPARYLAIAGDSGAQAYSPTLDNIFFGDYALRLPFELVVSQDLPEATLSSLLNALYAPRMTQLLEANGFIPIPEPERNSLLSAYGSAD